jgi:hypothetical protein
MADPKEHRGISTPSDAQKGKQGSPVEDPGHTRTQAEGDTDPSPRRADSDDEPGKTPGMAEGES